MYKRGCTRLLNCKDKKMILSPIAKNIPWGQVLISSVQLLVMFMHVLNFLHGFGEMLTRSEPYYRQCKS